MIEFVFYFSLIFSIQTSEIEIKVFDTPNDAGKSITLSYVIKEPFEFSEVIVLRRKVKEEKWDTVKVLKNAETTYVDAVEDRVPYKYKLVFITPQGFIESPESPEVMSYPQWFNTKRVPILIGFLVYLITLLVYIRVARKGNNLYLRKIAGLEAIDDAVGRATEMGKPILYIPGLSTISDIATIASLNILSHVTKKAAEYETPIIVPNRDPVVYTVSREIVKEAYAAVGRPDLFKPENIFYVTDSQFGYAAAVCGIMVREKPATNFLLGMFWAESLILAETGAVTGAVQISGTDAVTQLPFFVVACDYTLIGEELYAASAYISKDPILIATLKGQDFMKVLFIIAITVGTILSLFGNTWIIKFFGGG